MVVYIDDEPLLCKAIHKLLTASDIPVTTFVDPTEALAYLAANPVDVVICDYRMPSLSGLDVLARLPRPIPFYLVSGELEVVQPRGALGVLDKPFSLPRLLDIVLQHVPRTG
jgi:CheY-like chemotaxis protein